MVVTDNLWMVRGKHGAGSDIMRLSPADTFQLANKLLPGNIMWYSHQYGHPALRYLVVAVEVHKTSRVRVGPYFPASLRSLSASHASTTFAGRISRPSKWRAKSTTVLQ
jgi:hypothetical protein